MTLNPLLTIGAQMRLAMLAHERLSRAAERARCVEVLAAVGIPAAALVFLFLAMYFRVMMEILIIAFKGVEYLKEIAVSVKSGAEKPHATYSMR